MPFGGPEVITGTAVPDSTVGKSGDTYLRVNSNGLIFETYICDSNSIWQLVAAVSTAPAWYVLTSRPSDSIGREGDIGMIYTNTAGPTGASPGTVWQLMIKTGGVWVDTSAVASA